MPHRSSLGKVGLALERLSTRKRINHAKDDPAGLVAVEELRGELTDLHANLKASRPSGLDRIAIATETISLIEDADFAEKSANLVQGQILSQAATAALAYAQQSHADTIGALLDRVDRPAK